MFGAADSEFEVLVDPSCAEGVVFDGLTCWSLRGFGEGVEVGRVDSGDVRPALVWVMADCLRLESEDGEVGSSVKNGMMSFWRTNKPTQDN